MINVILNIVLLIFILHLNIINHIFKVFIKFNLKYL